MRTKVDLRWHLRVTLLPQCNFRCRYCNPKGIFQKAETLSDDEIITIVQAAVKNGIVRVHWTGGEPCIKDVVTLFKRATDAGMEQQVLTTNGSLRTDEIGEMKQAGLDRVNISLDSLLPWKNKEITGKKHFYNTLKWIETACALFDIPTKMNIVPMTDNINEVPNFIKFAQKFNGKLILKFIELCPNNPAFFDTSINDYYVSREQLILKLQKVGDLSRVNNVVGDNPNAEYYIVGDTGVIVTLITMPSQNFKCGLRACRKMRVSPFGLVGSCINQKGIDLKGMCEEDIYWAIKNRMEIRNGYSDIAPVNRQHLRRDYGIWRFGQVKECMA